MTQNVTLEVSTTDSDGFTQTTAYGGTTHYYYRFSGGNMGDGSVVTKVGTPQDIVFKLLNSPGFTITYAQKKGDADSQLSWSMDSGPYDEAKTLTYHDKADQAEMGMEISIVVMEISTSKDFFCDPRVSNED